jgi:hypothetical protein
MRRLLVVTCLAALAVALSAAAPASAAPICAPGGAACAEPEFYYCTPESLWCPVGAEVCTAANGCQNVRTASAPSTRVVGANARNVLAVVSSTVQTATARTINQTGKGQILPSETLGRMNVSLECTAVATPNPLATGIEQCFLLGANGARYNAVNDGALPGAADASVHAQLSVPTQSYRVCVQSQAFFQNNVLLKAPVVCTS